jgi:hypothetical protein
VRRVARRVDGPGEHDLITRTKGGKGLAGRGQDDIDRPGITV